MFRLYEVDPDADALIIVPTPSMAFAPWVDAGSATSAYAGILRGTSRPLNIYASIASSPELRIKVSSKHLSLASRHFRNKFKWIWTDPNSVAADGRVHITLAGFDPKAVIIVMDIIHGRGKKVPQLLDIEMLAKIAVFVDAFKCYEAVEAYADRWFGDSKLETKLPTTYNRDLVLWVYVAYVFHRAGTFRQVTRTAISKSDRPLSPLGLAIGDGVIAGIDSQRQDLVGQAVSLVHSTIDDLRGDKLSCPLGCDTFLLGSLIKTLHRRNLVWPRPAKPYLGMSLAGITQSVSEARSQESQSGPGLWLNWGRSQDKSRKRRAPNSRPGQALTPDSSPEQGPKPVVHECEAGVALSQQLDILAAGVKGLELESDLGYYLY